MGGSQGLADQDARHAAKPTKSTAVAEKHRVVRITERRDHAGDLWSIRVAPEEPIAFRPGQYVTLGVRVGERVLERAYSIVSSPAEEELEFFFELVPHGSLTPHLHKLKVGDTLLMRRNAKGLFMLDTASGRTSHCLIGTVTGVAPYVSMARTFARQAENGDPVHRLVAIQGASRSWEFGYADELSRLAGQWQWFEYLPTVSRCWEDPAWQGEVGRVEDVLRKHLDGYGLRPGDTTIYLCGHPLMIENTKGILTRCGFTKDVIHEEVYWVPRK